MTTTVWVIKREALNGAVDYPGSFFKEGNARAAAAKLVGVDGSVGLMTFEVEDEYFCNHEFEGIGLNPMGGHTAKCVKCGETKTL